MEKKIATKLAIFVAISSLFVAIRAVSAASLYFSPSSDGRLVNRSFTVGIYVSSPDQAMNAAQGTISFAADKLEVISLSKTSSIITLWVQEPSFSNREGTINFGGVVVNPGFQNKAGKILSATFRVKAAGRANLSFLSGSVLANDGKGTNITDSLGSASFTLEAAAAAPIAETAPAPQLIINSNPAIEDNKWYNFDNIEFSWQLPAGATGVNYDISDNPDYQLAAESRGQISKASYNLKNFADGRQYFFVRFQTSAGWSTGTRKILQLDRTPPEPFSIARKDDDFTNPQPVFEWQTTDKTSGLAYYRAKIGEGDWFNPDVLKSSSYTLPFQSVTESRNLVVRAYDQAGNFREAATTFQVKTLTALDAWWRAFIQFFLKYWWILVIAAIIAIACLYFLIYRLLKWRTSFKKELFDFKSELRRDLKHLEEKLKTEEEKELKVDLRPSRLQEAAESLTEEVKHIEADIKKEIKKIDDFTAE